jgi:hypothetical protein
MDDLAPRGTAFNAPTGEWYFTEREPWPSAQYPVVRAEDGIKIIQHPARSPAAAFDEADAIAGEIRRDLPVFVRIIFILIGAITAASVAGFALHTFFSAFK